MSLLRSMAWALALTELLEILFSLLWGLRRRQLLLVLLMNLLTNPAANLLYIFLVPWLGCPAALAVSLLEVVVVLVEYRCCKGIIPNPLAFSFLVNSVSYGMGALIQAL